MASSAVVQARVPAPPESTLLDRTTDKRRVCVIAAVAATAAIAPILFAGLPDGHDLEFHATSWLEVVLHWRAGIFFPHWAALANGGFGEPRFIFYPPLSWLLGGALAAVLSLTAAVATYIWITIAVACVSMRALAREWLDDADALWAGLFFALNPYHLVVIYWRSALAELFASALFPALLLYAIRSARGKREALAPMAALFALIWLADAPAAVLAGYAVALVVILIAFGPPLQRILQRPWTASADPLQRLRPERSKPLLWALAPPESPFRHLLLTTCYLLLAFSCAAFYIIPASIEQKWISIDQVLTPPQRPQDNFLFHASARPLLLGANSDPHALFNLLVSCLALAELIGFAVFVLQGYRSRGHSQSVADRTRNSSWLPIVSLLGCVSMLMMFRIASPLWNLLPKLQFVQFPWRLLFVFNVAFAVALAAGVRRRWVRAIVLLLLVAGTLIGATRIVEIDWGGRDTIAASEAAFATGHGYEGNWEYAPLNADLDALPQMKAKVDAARPDSAGESSGEVTPLDSYAIAVLRWDPEAKYVHVISRQPATIKFRLLKYPAWKAMVNGRPANVDSTSAGPLELNVPAGDNHIQVSFHPTRDRTIGVVLSLSSIFALMLVEGFRRKAAGNREERLLQ